MRGQRDNSGNARKAKTDIEQRDPRATLKEGKEGEAARGAGARSFSSQVQYEREKGGGGGGEGKGGRRQEQADGGK